MKLSEKVRRNDFACDAWSDGTLTDTATLADLIEELEEELAAGRSIIAGILEALRGG